MSKRGFVYLIGFLALILAVGLACGSTTPAPSSPQVIVVTATTQASLPTGPTDAGPASSSGGSGLVTYTDQNKYFAIDLPGNWTHKSGSDTNVYTDTFSTPDQHGFVESVVYDDGTPWTGSSSGKGALYLLNNYYSSTKQEGDIRVSSDSIEKDGSEKLVWTSKGGNYSGVSWFEIRKPTAFLMFTIWWDNAYEEQYRQTLDDVVSSYRIP